MDATTLIRLLDLTPHPIEGGYFRETYRSNETIDSQSLPARYGGKRNFATAIYYLLTPETASRIHRISSDEVFHFYLGDPVQMIQLLAGGEARLIALGPDIEAGHVSQAVVPHGVWQGACLIPGGRFALLGCTVAPGFDYADYEEGQADQLLAQYGHYHDLIRRLTK